MLVQKEFFQRLKDDFKLNIYEVKIWTSLLARGIAAAGELADISGVPRSRCYDVLESLEKKGFIIMKIGRPIKYIAVYPEDIMARVKKNLEKEQEINLKIINEIKKTDIFKELNLLHQTGIEKVNSTELTDFVVGRSNIFSQIKKMIDAAKKSVVISTTKKGFERKSRLLRKIVGRLNKQDIDLKIIAPVEQIELKRLGIGMCNIKNKNISARFVIVDKNEALFMLSENSEQEYDSAVWIKSPFFVSAFMEMFEESLNKV